MSLVGLLVFSLAETGSLLGQRQHPPLSSRAQSRGVSLLPKPAEIGTSWARRAVPPSAQTCEERSVWTSVAKHAKHTLKTR